MRDDTLAVHATTTKPGEGLTPPIHQAATFRLADADEGAAYAAAVAPERFYTRWGNPTVRALEDTVARLEGAEAGLATGSGMGAIATLFLAHARKGERIVAQQELYAGTSELLGNLLPQLGCGTGLVPSLDEEAWKEAVTPDVGLVYLETPSNPSMDLADIRLVSDLAEDRGGIPVAVDNTFASPINQRPIEHGATYAVHSATKFLGGHSDATGGVLLGPEQAIAEAWRTYKTTGPSLAPMEAYLVLRGTKTLSLRVRKQNENAQALAEWLADHEAVSSVSYPGLPDHSGHAVAKRQMRGFGGMLTFEVAAGLEAARKVVESTQLMALAVSLGGVESLIQHPATMTHAPLSPEQRRASGVTDGQVRVSVGIEDVEDLKEDLGRALGSAG